MKIIFKLLIAGFLFLICNTNLIAQNKSSAIDSIGEGLTLPGSSEDTAGRGTVLKRNNFETGDSMQAYRTDRDFAYMKYLDSLLRQTKDLTVDTFSISNSGSLKRQKNISQNSQYRNTSPRLNFFSLPIVKIILWIMAIFLIGFIIYKLFLGENFFRRSYKNISGVQKEEEEISDPSAYDKLIARAVMNNNYRLAIRYRYLQTLQMLAGNRLLQFSVDKTNYQYVNELHGKPYQNDFAAITLNYEYVWYGKFDISEEVYNKLFTEYKTFHQKL
ncbi:MAG: hypothetical protein WKF59_25765 [Chitinophagaceae bacterium]